MSWQPLLELRRAGLPEVVVHGAVAWVSGTRLIHSYGGDPPLYGRSLVKPFQMKVFARELNRVLSPEQKALSLASHNGTMEQVHIAQSILPAGDWPLLRVPESKPLSGEPVSVPSRWYHPCSGKHAAILVGCHSRGWSRDRYFWPDHPYQQAVEQVLRERLGADWKPTQGAGDGCGLPTVAMPLSQLAALFASLCRERNEDWIWRSMVDHPRLIGGAGRLDTAILEAGHGKVLAKEGADGLLGLAITHKDYPDGLGIVIKIAHGWDSAATWRIAQAVLAPLGVDLPAAPKLHRQTAHVAPEVSPGG
jgi:L-asparaginase